MSKSPKSKPYVPTKPADVGEGRALVLDRDSAQAIADASEKAGFPVPPAVAAALGIEAQEPGGQDEDPGRDEDTETPNPSDAGDGQTDQQEG